MYNEDISKFKPLIKLYDSTLRDGAQTKGVNFSLTDKLKIYEILDDIRVVSNGFDVLMDESIDNSFTLFYLR